MITLNCRSIIMILFFDWMSLLFKGFVFIIYSWVILYSEDYRFGVLNMIRFILLALIVFVSKTFLNFSPSVINILLGWYGLGLVSYLLLIYYHELRK